MVTTLDLAAAEAPLPARLLGRFAVVAVAPPSPDELVAIAARLLDAPPPPPAAPALALLSLPAPLPCGLLTLPASLQAFAARAILPAAADFHCVAVRLCTGGGAALAAPHQCATLFQLRSVLAVCAHAGIVG